MKKCKKHGGGGWVGEAPGLNHEWQITDIVLKIKKIYCKIDVH